MYVYQRNIVAKCTVAAYKQTISVSLKCCFVYNNIMLWTKRWSGHWCLDLFADIKVCPINLMKRANAHICPLTIPLSWFCQLDVSSQKPPTLIPQIMRKYYSFVTIASRFKFGFITVLRLIRKHLHRLWAFWMEVGRTSRVSASQCTHWGLRSSASVVHYLELFLNSWILIEIELR